MSRGFRGRKCKAEAGERGHSRRSEIDSPIATANRPAAGNAKTRDLPPPRERLNRRPTACSSTRFDRRGEIELRKAGSSTASRQRVRGPNGKEPEPLRRGHSAARLPIERSKRERLSWNDVKFVALQQRLGNFQERPVSLAGVECRLHFNRSALGHGPGETRKRSNPFGIFVGSGLIGTPFRPDFERAMVVGPLISQG